MRTARPRAFLLPTLLALAALSFGTGINWGLPSRDADPYLFGSRTPWTGDEVMRLAGPWQPAADRGSDRPQHAGAPLTTILNATDADRAEIVRRYRLYSSQPDEMITFRSLSRMRPTHGDLDPRLYQYGGLWIYPVGGLLRLAAMAHLIVLRTDLAFYLDHPDAFARFYLVARLYSAAWGLVGVVVVYGLVRELMRPTLSEPSGSAAGSSLLPEEPAAEPLGSDVIAATAAGIYAVMPVVINAAHEAKPHLAGTVLTLATAWAAARYVRTGRGWATAGVLAGAAAGMILTGVAAWVILPVMAWLRPGRRLRTAVLACAVAGVTFVVTNPYLPFDALFHRERLTSNVGNYGNFYRPGVSINAITTAGKLLVVGLSPVPAIIAPLGAILTICNLWKPRRQVQPPLYRSRSLLLIAPALWVAAQFILLAEGKPAEYARFALTLDVAAAILAAVALRQLPLKPREAKMAGILLIAATALYGLRYDLNFLADSRPASTRRTTADRLAKLVAPGRHLRISADPAPYNLPPVDLFTWRIELAHDGVAPPTGVLVRPTDSPEKGLPSPISWANKPFEIVTAAGQR